jgi:hypothetical protein
LSFANPTLMLLEARDLGLLEPGVRVDPGELRRTERMAMQCAKCRRKTARAA